MSALASPGPADRLAWARDRLALAVALVAALVVAVAIGLVSTQLPGVLALYGVLAIVLALGAAVVLAFWRVAVYAVFILVFVEGFFRNLLDLPAILLVKDAVISLLYVRVAAGLAFHRFPAVRAGLVLLPMALFVLTVFVQALNPYVASAPQALVGIRTWLLYVPLFFVAPALVRDRAEAKRFVTFYLVSALMICSLAMYQYFAGPDAYAALGPAFENATFKTQETDLLLELGEFTFRPNAGFAWPSHFGAYLGGSVLLAFGALMDARGRARWLLWALTALQMVTLILAGQRTLLILLPVLVLLVLALSGRLVFGLRVAALALVGVLVVGQATGSLGLERLRSLVGNREGQIGDRAGAFWSNIQMALDSSPYGLGAGATGIGTRYAGDEIRLFVEGSWAMVIGDLSVAGLAIYSWLMVALMVNTFRAHRREKETSQPGFAGFTAGVFAFQLLVFYSGYDLAAAAVPFWFMCGLAERIRTLAPSQAPVAPVAPVAEEAR
jgi:hypothetical protein